MNSRPMILRFSSGRSRRPARRGTSSDASTTLSETPVAATKSRSTCSASPLRSRPWSTNTQVSWSPTARCTSAAATAESTPPDSPQMARLSPTCVADLLDLLVDDVDHRPGRPAAGDVDEELLEHLLAVLGVQHLGVPLHAGQPAARASSNAATGVLVGRGERGEAGRRAATASPWLIHTRWPAGSPASSVPGSVTVTSVRPNSDRPVRATSPPSASAIAWKP